MASNIPTTIELRRMRTPYVLMMFLLLLLASPAFAFAVDCEDEDNKDELECQVDSLSETADKVMEYDCDGLVKSKSNWKVICSQGIKDKWNEFIGGLFGEANIIEKIPLKESRDLQIIVDGYKEERKSYGELTPEQKSAAIDLFMKQQDVKDGVYVQTAEEQAAWAALNEEWRARRQALWKSVKGYDQKYKDVCDADCLLTRKLLFQGKAIPRYKGSPSVPFTCDKYDGDANLEVTCEASIAPVVGRELTWWVRSVSSESEISLHLDQLGNGASAYKQTFTLTPGKYKIYNAFKDKLSSGFDQEKTITANMCWEAKEVVCEFPGGKGIKTRVCNNDGSLAPEGSCVATSCNNSAYVPSGDKCIIKTECQPGVKSDPITCELKDAWLNVLGTGIQTKTCKSDGFWEDNYGPCEQTTCINGKTPTGLTCIPLTDGCSPGQEYPAVTCQMKDSQGNTIGTGNQTKICDNNGFYGEFGTCRATSCQSGYTHSGDQCIKNASECSFGEQSEPEFCYIKDGAGDIFGEGERSKTCNSSGYWGSFGSCQAYYCISGYHTSGSQCLPDSTPPVSSGAEYWVWDKSDPDNVSLCIGCLPGKPANYVFLCDYGSSVQGQCEGTYNKSTSSVKWESGNCTLVDNDVFYLSTHSSTDLDWYTYVNGTYYESGEYRRVDSWGGGCSDKMSSTNPPPDPSSSNATMTWKITDKCDDSKDVDYKFYAQDRDVVWPATNRYYRTSGYMVTGKADVPCNSGEMVCFGGKPTGGTGGWGVNYDGSGLGGYPSCRTCSTGDFSYNPTCSSGSGSDSGLVGNFELIRAFDNGSTGVHFRYEFLSNGTGSIRSYSVDGSMTDGQYNRFNYSISGGNISFQFLDSLVCNWSEGRWVGGTKDNDTTVGYAVNSNSLTISGITLTRASVGNGNPTINGTCGR